MCEFARCIVGAAFTGEELVHRFVVGLAEIAECRASLRGILFRTKDERPASGCETRWSVVHRVSGRRCFMAFEARPFGPFPVPASLRSGCPRLPSRLARLRHPWRRVRESIAV